MDLSNKTVVITGATGGIGQAFARSLAAKGASLLLVARNKVQLIAMVKQLASEDLGTAHEWLSADITSEAGRVALITRARELKASMLINNAGVSQFDALANISEADFRASLELNLMAPICLTRAFLHQVNNSEVKTIVNVGSALGSIGFPYYSSYCASKFGLRGFSEALARELAFSDDKILYFAPRATSTTLNSDAVNAMNKKLGHGVDSPEVVAAALMKQLASGKKRMVVGWPEKLFARLNGLWPEVVDRALSKKLKNLRQFVRLAD